MKYFGKCGWASKILEVAVILALQPCLGAQDINQTFIAPLRAYCAFIQNSTVQYEVESTTFGSEGVRTVRGVDAYTYAYPKIKVVRERSYSSLPATREEFVFDGSIFQGLSANKVLYIGRNRDLYQYRLDIESPLLIPLNFIFIPSDLKGSINDLQGDDIWLDLKNNCKLITPESVGERQTIRYAAKKRDNTSVEVIIETGNNHLPKQWAFTASSPQRKGKFEVKSWKIESGVPIPSEVFYKDFDEDGTLRSQDSYRLKSFSVLNPALISDDTFRISSELAKTVIDCDANSTFTIPK